MYKYENIKKVLTFVPLGLLEEENEATLIKWALQGYSANVRNANTTDDILFCILQIVDHKATLPTGFKKILEVGYSETLPNDVLNSPTIFIQPTIDGERVTIFQASFYQYFRSFITYMRYVGQNPALFDNNCINLLCEDCQVNFSISKDLTTMTADIEEGYVTMLYRTAVKSEDGDYLIPDDNNLWQALAYYVTAMGFRDRSFRKEEGANALFRENLSMANNLFKTFQKEDLFRKFDPYDYYLKTQAVRHAAQMSAERDNYNYKRR